MNMVLEDQRNWMNLSSLKLGIDVLKGERETYRCLMYLESFRNYLYFA
jgi:hypothetical protein